MASGTNYSLFQSAPLYAQNQGIVDAHDLYNMFWGGQVVGETVLALAKPQSIDLWRKPASIVSVKHPYLGVTYSAGTDYIATACGFDIPAGSTIPVAPAGYLTTVNPSSPYASQSYSKTGGPLRLEEDYPLYQITVKYNTRPFHPAAVGPLPAYSGMLSAHTASAVTWFGNSIMQGASSSSSQSRAPNSPNYVTMVMAALSTVAPGAAYWRNIAVGGMSSEGAINSGALSVTPSDVVVLDFGMNDASGNVSKETHKYRTALLINQARSVNPNCEFILVSGITSNPDWMHYYPRFRGYRDAYRELVGEYSTAGVKVSVADVTAPFDEMLVNKSYYDLTGNGVNHPNDFIHRIYAQVLIQLLVGSGP